MTDKTLNAKVNITTGGSVAALASAITQLRELDKQLVSGDRAVSERALAMQRLTRAIATAEKAIADAAIASGKTQAQANEQVAKARRESEAAADREAKAVENAEKRKQAAVRQTAAAEKQTVKRNTTTTSNPSTPGGAYVNRNLGAALGDTSAPQKSQLAAMGNFYRQQEAMQQQSAVRQAALDKQIADQKVKQAQNANRQMLADEAAANKSRIAANRGMAQSAFGLPDVGTLNQTRYALYDVSTTLAILGGALGAAGVASTGFAIKYETAIAQVSRTTQLAVGSVELGDLVTKLRDLSETIPVGFENLAGIASLGAQLNIASEDLDSFTETVAQYSAVTGVSGEQTAQSFGAIGELLDVTASQYQNLGSAINYAGVKSVATDAEILSLTTSIAASANQAGFGADKTVGLAAAIASLRIAPEQARGVILRLFSSFDRVTSEGGESLDRYAKVLGVTSEQAKALWDTDAEGFFNKLLKGLSVADDLNGALRGLGITETRESNVLQRLAGNYNVYADSIQNATSAYSDGTFLGESFGTIAETVQAKIQTLLNSIQNLFATAGAGLLPVLGIILEVIQSVVNAVGAVPAPILAAVTAASLLAGGLLLVVAGGAAFLASAFAVQTALRGITTRETETLTVSAGLRDIYRQLTVGIGINSAAARVNAVTFGTVAGAMRATGVAAGSASVGLNGATTATTGFKAALLGVPIINVVAGLSILLPLVFGVADALNSASREAQDARDAFITAGGGMESLQAALDADTATGEGYGTVTSKISETVRAKAEDADESARAAQAAQNLAGTNEDLGGAVDGGTAALREQVYVLGEATAAWTQNALANSQAVKDLAANEAGLNAFNNFGIDVPNLIKQSLAGDGSYEKTIAELKAKINTAIEQADLTGIDVPAAYAAQDALDLIVTQIAAIRTEAAAGGRVNDLLGIDPTATTEADLMSQAVKGLEDSVRSLFSQFGAEAGFLDAMDALNASIDENGVAFDNLSQGGRANLAALEDALANATTYGAQLGISAEDSIAQALFSVNGRAIDTGSLLQQLASVPAEFQADLDISAVIAKYNKIASLGIGAGAITQAANKNELSRLTAQRDALKKQQTTPKGGGGGGGGRKPSGGGDAKKAADSIKTAAEYSKDLSTALKEAFDKRFGVAQAADDVASKINSIAKNAADARQKIRDLNADLNTLAADRGVLQAQLIVAENYQDDTRAAQLRAQLGENTNSAADKTAELAKATEAASLTLIGNSQAAIDNRAALLGLVSAYQEQIVAYAATGASAAEVSAYAKTLQGQFIAQATQLGFNAATVQSYAGTFDALTVAVAKVPTNKNVNVSANTAGASSNIANLSGQIDALDAQIARLNGDIAAAAAKDAAASSKAARGSKLRAEINSLNQALAVSPGVASAGIIARLDSLNRQLTFGNYASGGIVGGGGRPTNRGVDDTLIMAQAGEGILKQQTMEWLGSDGLDALNNRQNPFAPQVIVQQGAPSSSSAVSVVELSAYDRHKIDQLIARTGVTIGNETVARATNSSNANSSRRGSN